MSQMHEGRAALVPPPERGGGLIRWVCTKNPFYVISAGLFLFGLRISFGDPTQAADTWAMMSGLAGYTLLLAAAACLLVRFANVWDDVRTVLLLVVLLFLATSVTFDEVLALTPTRGIIVYVLGLLFAIGVSEGILRSIRLRLPAGYRLPYHLILALFFLYPPLLSTWVDQPRSEAMLWGLYGFGCVAAVVFLSLLPALRRGPEYVRGNGSPWGWPLYPWTLFGLLALAVPARSFLLCWSMHLLDNGDLNALVFGPHFLAPFGLAVALLLLESGLQGPRRGPIVAALVLPLLLVALCLVGHRPEPIYDRFLTMFQERVGAAPALAALAAALAFYVYAGLRGAAGAVEMMAVSLAGFGLLTADTRWWHELGPVQPAPLFAAGMLLVGVGIGRGQSWRVALGAVALAAGVAATRADAPLPYGPVLLGHGVVALMLIIGGFYNDPFAIVLRVLGVFAVLVACLLVLLAPTPMPRLPAWVALLYPAVLGVLMTLYALAARDAFAAVTGGIVLLLWLVLRALQGYELLRLWIRGLDYLAGGLALLALAVFISLAKSRLLRAPGPSAVIWQRTD